MTSSKCANPSAGFAPRWAAMSLACMRPKLNPEPISLGKKLPPVIFAVAVMWATTSWTVHLVQSDVADHCSSESDCKSVRSAFRSS